MSGIYKTTKLDDVRFKANELINNIKNFNFMFAWTVLKSIPIQIRIISEKLQSLDLIVAVSIVETLKTSLINLRSDEDNYFELYENVMAICHK